jgi:long-chain acyl-CoA synthetase
VPPNLTFPHQSIWESLDVTVAAYGDRPAFVFRDDVMTFADLKRQSEWMSGALARIGVKRGDVVLLLLPNVPHFPVSYYGTMRVGACVAAASPTSVEREIEYAIKDSGAKTVITLDLLYDRVATVWQRTGIVDVVVGTVADFMPGWKGTLGRVTGRLPRPKEPVPYGNHVHPMARFLRSGRTFGAPAATDAADPALLQYTGGTTGIPKAATLTHGSLLANARQMIGWFPTLKPGEETILAVLPFFHVYGVTLAMNAGILLAARNILIPRPIPSEIFEAIGKYRPSVFPGVPTIFLAVINDERHKNYDLSSIDVCVSGGAPLPLEIKREFERLTGRHLYEGYGLSEASPCTHACPYDGRNKVGSMGLPLSNTDVRVVDEAWNCVPVGAEGEMIVRGPQIMRDYWRRPEETADVLRDGWLRTGDIARMDDEGWFYIVDRKKDLIITGGENVYPREIEEVLFEHPAIQEVAVVGVHHPFGGEVAKAFVVLKPGATATKKDITQFASQRLSRQKVPRAVEFRTDLPKSAAQKVLRRVLAEQEAARQAALPRRRRGTAREKSSGG